MARRLPGVGGDGLLFQVSVGAVLVGLFSPPSQASSADSAGIEPWVFVMVYSSFARQGAALAIAFACHVRARWGKLLGERTGEVVARRTAEVRSWPDNHLARAAEAVAGLTFAVALVCGYWAAAVGVLAVIAAAKDKRRPAAATPPRPKIADSGATRLKEIA